MPFALLMTLIIAPPTTLTPEITRLDNGLDLVILEDHTRPRVSVQLWYRVGSATDDPNTPGLCHVAQTLLAHRADATSQPRPASVQFEGRTLRDACCFIFTIPPSAHLLSYALRTTAKRMHIQPVDQTELSRALAAVTRNSDTAVNAGQADASGPLLGAAFQAHPYGHAPQAVSPVAAAITPEQVNAFLQRWFVPARAVLIVIGDIQPPAVLDLAHRNFDALPWAEPPRPADLPELQPEQVHLPTAESTHAGLDFAWVTPAAGASENAAIDVLMHHLCNPVDGPLCVQLLNAGCTPPRWRHDSWREAGLLVLSINMSAEAQPPDRIERIVTAVLAEAEHTTPSEIGHDRARALAARAHRLRSATFAQRAFDFGQSEAVAGDLMLAETRPSDVARIGVGDMRHAAACLRATRTVILPRHVGPIPATVPAAASLPAAPPQSDTASPPPNRVGTVTTCDIAPGVRIVVHRIPGALQTTVRTWLQPGHRLAPALHALMAVGSARHSVDELRDYLSYHGLDLFPVSELWRAGLRSRGPAHRVAQMIELQAELLRFPNRSVAGCANGATRMAWLRTWCAELSPGESREIYLPPGLIGCASTDRFAANADTLRHALARLHTRRRVEIVVTGAVEPNRVCEVAADVWSERPHRSELPAPAAGIAAAEHDVQTH